MIISGPAYRGRILRRVPEVPAAEAVEEEAVADAPIQAVAGDSDVFRWRDDEAAACEMRHYENVGE